MVNTVMTLEVGGRVIEARGYNILGSWGGGTRRLMGGGVEVGVVGGGEVKVVADVVCCGGFGALRVGGGRDYGVSILSKGVNIGMGFVDSISYSISPFGPITASVEFTVPNFQGGGKNLMDGIGGVQAAISDDKVGYGIYTTVGSGSMFGAETLTYKETWERQYGKISNLLSPNSNECYVTSYQRELNLKTADLSKFITYSGDITPLIKIEPRNRLGEEVVEGGLVMGVGARITNQNFTIAEGDVVMMDLSMKELVF